METINYVNIHNEVNELFHKITKEAVLIILNEFPNKIKQIEMLRKEFDWNKIFYNLETDTDTEWISSFAKNLDRTNGLLINHHSDGLCIQNCDFKPFLFDAYLEHKTSSKDQMETAMIGTNKVVHNLINRIQPFLNELINLTLKIDFAFKLLLPKIQEGQNFGVQVQIKALNNVSEIFETSLDQFNILNLYYGERILLLFNMMIYPQIEDYQQSLTELDHNILNFIRLTINQLYNSYNGLHDYVVKNLNKLIQPRD